MNYDVRVWRVGDKWRASVDWEGERLYGEADTPAKAIVELGFYWEGRSSKDDGIITLMKLAIQSKWCG